ncbi:hypothetical protein EJ02DRAFT_455193 [Clathrospora elynae]|uniref:Uncharacterized protein n=1 Tax=Clathrospora elynae TaxID=706981 RepID=A0A6A5SWJ9_9PLEO|nr:hypothetical protein EJ02DRAFT_455193 [Clathrospora elynae]
MPLYIFVPVFHPITLSAPSQRARPRHLLAPLPIHPVIPRPPDIAPLLHLRPRVSHAPILPKQPCALLLVLLLVQFRREQFQHATTVDSAGGRGTDATRGMFSG